MNVKSQGLEMQQQEMERQIIEFIEENERIREALHQRDIEAERVKQRNR